MVHDNVAMGNKNRYVLALCMIGHCVWQVFDCWGAWLHGFYVHGGHVLSHDWFLGLQIVAQTYPIMYCTLGVYMHVYVYSNTWA